MTRSEELFKKAVTLMPGGVNSPVRAFGSVGSTPRFIEQADGVYMTDVDGNKYLDFIGSWGPMILGHNHPAIKEAVIKACEKGLSFGAATEKEVEMAELMTDVIPSLEMVRMVNSGTEAVMSAIRAARGYTRRDKIVKFTGCYHGHSDALLVKAGSGVMTAGIPDSAGVPAGCTQDTLSAIYNDLASVEALFAEYPKEIAAVIVEPVAANMGVVPPKKGFLEGLREFCSEHGSVLIFDEVITGFRLGLQGAGLFWYRCRSCDIRQDHRSWHAGRSLRIKTRDHGDGLTGRSVLSGRNLKRQSGCHGSRHCTAYHFEKQSADL